MKVELYINESDEKEMFKGPTLVGSLDNVMWEEDTDILNPILTFHKSNVDGWIEFNYIKINWGKVKPRWYFVEKPIAKQGGIVEIQCHEDVRFTWRKWVMSQFYLVSRQEYICDKTIQDDRKVIPMTRQVDSVGVKFGPGVVGDTGDGTIILTVSG